MCLSCSCWHLGAKTNEAITFVVWLKVLVLKVRSLGQQPHQHHLGASKKQTLRPQLRPTGSETLGRSPEICVVNQSCR